MSYFESGGTSPYQLKENFRVSADNVDYNEEFIRANYLYRSTRVRSSKNGMIAVPVEKYYMFRTKREVPRTGLMIVGIGGNNGTTVVGGILANKHKISWETRAGTQSANYFGSLALSTVTQLGVDEQNRQVFVPLGSLLPMADPNDLVISGWDVNSAPLDKAMGRAQVYPYALQQKLRPLMSKMRPLPSIYYPDFIAANQSQRADNVLPGDRACEAHLEHLRRDIREFRDANKLDKVIVVWSANTERYSEVISGVHDTEENFLAAIRGMHTEIAPSQVFAAASILEGCAFINGSPQNTFCPALLEMAQKRGIFIGGDDFKSGQTKIKSVLVDFLVASGLKPESIVSYNHLGNNDGKNLNEHRQFRSKEISKSNVVDDVVGSNQILYGPREKPDHCVVIKYVPFVADSKRAMDEYTSRIFMNGFNTIVLHNTCEDSLLAAPIIIDLVLFTELFQRIEWKLTYGANEQYQPFGSILTILSFLLKAPLVPENSPLVNALFKQRACVENIMRACVGLPPVNDMLLEQKTLLARPLRSAVSAFQQFSVETNGNSNFKIKEKSNSSKVYSERNLVTDKDGITLVD